MKRDTRPKRGWWAPGGYIRLCLKCNDPYCGDKRSSICADCAYADYVPEPLTKAEADKIIAEGEVRYAAVLELRIQQLEDAAEVAANQIKLMAELHSKRTLEEHKRVLELEAAIRKTLDENRHLADGEDCTLRELKKVLPTWN